MVHERETSEIYFMFIEVIYVVYLFRVCAVRTALQFSVLFRTIAQHWQYNICVRCLVSGKNVF